MKLKFGYHQGKLILEVKLNTEAAGKLLYDAVVQGKVPGQCIRDYDFCDEQLVWFCADTFSAMGTSIYLYSSISEFDPLDNFNYTRVAACDCKSAEWMWIDFVKPLRQLLSLLPAEMVRYA